METLITSNIGEFNTQSADEQLQPLYNTFDITSNKFLYLKKDFHTLFQAKRKEGHKAGQQNKCSKRIRSQSGSLGDEVKALVS